MEKPDSLDMQTMNKQQSQMPSQMPSQSPMQMPMQQSEMPTRIVYPEIFYKLQPYVIMICDQMDAYNCQMPTQEMMEQMTDNIYDDMCQMYPDMVEYVERYEKTSKTDSDVTDVVAPFSQGRYRRNFRRRGAFKDIIEILLLSELFRRRRRYY